jgi:hypothetical protein
VKKEKIAEKKQYYIINDLEYENSIIFKRKQMKRFQSRNNKNND